MRNFLKVTGIATLLIGLLISCGDKKDNNDLLLGAALLFAQDSNSSVDTSAFLARYADMAHSSYEKAYDSSVELKTALDALAENPTDDTLTAAREAYTNARNYYLQTEVFRFSGGPIDNADANDGDGYFADYDYAAGDLEVRMNAWPLNELYIECEVIGAEYILGPEGSHETIDLQDSDNSCDSVSSHTKAEITEATILAAFDPGDTEEKVTTGWHVLEYMLWGQDSNDETSDRGPDAPHDKDYFLDTDVPADVTGTLGERRSKYVVILGDVLQKQLKLLTDEWADDGAFRAEFLADDSSMANVLSGIATFAQAELGGERFNGVTTFTQNDDEHSCFSDSTNNDFYYDMVGIENVMNGTLDDESKDGLKTLDSEIGESILEALVDGKAVFEPHLKSNESDSDSFYPYDLVISSELIEDFDPESASNDSYTTALYEQGLKIRNEVRPAIVGIAQSLKSLGGKLGITVTPNLTDINIQ